ncbi:MAG: hypothetical protein ACYCYE_14215 [Clostridia bacterium]
MKKVLSNRYVKIIISLVLSGMIVDLFIDKYIYNSNMKMIVTFGGTIIIASLVFYTLTKIIGNK